MLTRLIIIGCSLLLSNFCLGQRQILYLNKIPQEEGLSQTDNAFLYSDRSGYVWIGSLDGVNLFDGKQVRVFKSRC